MRRRHSSRFTSGRKRGRLFLPLLVLALFAGGVSWYLFFESEPPQAQIDITTPYLGKNAIFEIQARDDKSGIKSVRVVAIQGEKERVLYQKENPRTGYRSPIGPQEERAKIAVDSKKLGLAEGPMQLVLEVTDFSMQRWFQGNKTLVTQNVTIDTEAPKIHILYRDLSATPGSTAIAIYRVDDRQATTGVQLNDRFNQGFPANSDHPDTYIAYYGIPYDVNAISELAIIATDKANNSTAVPISANFRTRNKSQDTINIGDNFLQRKVPEFRQYYPEMAGNMVEQYIYVNNAIRKKNGETIEQICQKSSPDRLWQGVFGRMAGSERAGFADYRSYMYKGKVIDHQVHLGIDIASIRRANVKAANSGIVAYADYLGIYGNMVILDHGQGVFSLYSHLSQIEVSEGAHVNKGEILGFTGTTGMAGGDHLHFSMLVHGLFVNPKEWWDKKWLQRNIEEPLQNLRLSAQKTN